jgi:hypothetical protein
VSSPLALIFLPQLLILLGLLLKEVYSKLQFLIDNLNTLILECQQYDMIYYSLFFSPSQFLFITLISRQSFIKHAKILGLQACFTGSMYTVASSLVLARAKKCFGRDFNDISSLIFFCSSLLFMLACSILLYKSLGLVIILYSV